MARILRTSRSDFVALESDGFELYQDATIEPPPVWRLVHKRVPARVEAFWGNQDWMGGGG